MGILTGLLKALAGRVATRRAGTDSMDSLPGGRTERALRIADSGCGLLPDQLADARAHIVDDPDDAAGWLALASTLMRWGRTREAFDAFHAAHVRDPASVRAALGLGVAAWEIGRRDDAERVLMQAAGNHPDSPDLALALARVFVSSGRIDEAVDFARRACAMDPKNATALATLARCEQRNGRDEVAERRLREAMAIDDADPTLWVQLGSMLASRAEPKAALEAFARAESLANRGGVELDTAFARAELMRQESDFVGATGLLVAALRRRPEANAFFALAEALIVQGRFAAGWRRYEFRRFSATLVAGQPHYRKPEWTGQDLAGRAILVEAEQGVGDVVWFARYLPLLGRLGARVIFLPRIDMMGVSRRLAGVDRVLVEGEPLPPFDFHVKLMSLAAKFGTTLATIPGGVPYLFPDPVRAERWRARLSSEGRPRVGIVWAGRPDQPRDRFRSLDLQQLLPLLRVPGVRFYSLQKGPAEVQLGALPGDVEISALGGELDDLDDLVAAVAEMDLVVSVCTGPAHIAGAMGKPVWTMISEPPDLRWLVGREDSPWYPTMRIFRQRTPGHWEDVVENVARAMAQGPAAWESLAAGRGARAGAAKGAGTPLLDDNIDAGMAGLTETRHGLFMFDPGEGLVGLSLERCGEWLEERLALALRFSRSGAVVVEAGAGVGVHAVALERALGSGGLLLVYEDRPVFRHMLKQNLAANGATAFTLMSRKLIGSAQGSFDAGHESIDDLKLEHLDGIKVNEGVDAISIVEGAGETLWRCRPWLLLAVAENDALAQLAARVRAFGYRTWRLDSALFSSTNFNRCEDDVFGGRRVLALVALPEENGDGEIPPDCVELR